MRKIGLGQTIHILANIGVIGGILLLAFELKQNNELMAAEARFNRLTMVSDAWRFRAENSDLANLRIRAINGDSLSEPDIWRIESSIMATFVLLQWTFRELPIGSPEIRQMKEVQRYHFDTDPSYQKVWETRSSAFDPDFVQWMEENVVNQ
jgi:hypothetical protein